MATQIQYRRGTTAQHSTFTGAIGELTVDTTKKTVVVHDGSTVGGIPLQKEDATLTSIAALGTAADKLAYTTGVDTWAETPLTPFARTILDDTTASAVRGTLGTVDGNDNIIINGGMTVWQDGTSFANPATGTYLADQWRRTQSNDGAVTYSQAAYGMLADGSAYCDYSLKATVTTADAAIAAGQYELTETLLEGYKIAHLGLGQTGTRYITLSFDVKASKTGIYCVSLASSGGARSYIAEYTVNAANTKERKTLIIPVDTTGTWLTTTGIGLFVRFALATGTTYQTAAGAWTAGNFFSSANQVNALDAINNTFEITGVKLESGSVATPFVSKGYGQEFIDCARYYEILGNDAVGNGIYFDGYTSAGASAGTYIAYAVDKRVQPTMTKVGTWTVSNCGQPNVGGNGRRGFQIRATATATGAITFGSSSTAYIVSNARM